jgi:hypothetical protein
VFSMPGGAHCRTDVGSGVEAQGAESVAEVGLTIPDEGSPKAAHGESSSVHWFCSLGGTGCRARLLSLQ